MDQSINQVQNLLPTLSVELSSTNISTLRLVDDALSSFVHTAVRTQLNQCAPVNRLAPEVLSAIFDLVRYGSSYSDGLDAGDHTAILQPDNRSLIAVTHACRQWRDVSLGHAHLWTSVSTHSPFAPTFFERSRGLPLTVFVRLRQGKPPSIPKQMFLDQHPRIRVLHIGLECSLQITHWKKLLQSVAKSLESLTVVTHGYQKHFTANRPLNLLLLFFGAERPAALKSLSISSRTPLIPTDHFPILEHAHLAGFQSRHGFFSNFKLATLFLLLLNAPRLQTFHLHLQSTYWHSVHEAFEDLGQITLPMMRHLCVTLPPRPVWATRQYEDPFSGICAMVASLHMPTTAMVSIQQGSCSRDGEIPLLYIPITASVSAESVLSVDSRETTFIVSGPQTAHFRFLSCFGFNGILSFVNGAPVLPAPVREKAQAALATVRALRIHSSADWLHSAQAFTSRSHSWVPAEPLSLLAARTPQLTELILRDYTGEMAPHLVHLLAHTGTGPVLCPNLASVTYITLGRPFDIQGTKTSLAFDLGSAPASEGGTAAPTSASTPTLTLGVILGATCVRAHALGRQLKRLVYCSPSAPRNLVLENVHGVERLSVLRTDVWAAHDGVFERGAERRCRVPTWVVNANKLARVARKAGSVARTAGEEYDGLWAAERACAAAAEEAQEGAGCGGTLSSGAVAACGWAQSPDCVDAGEASSSPASESESESSVGPGMRMVGGLEFEHPNRAAARPEIGGNNGDADESVRVLATYFDLVCCLLSLWFVQLLSG